MNKEMWLLFIHYSFFFFLYDSACTNFIHYSLFIILLHIKKIFLPWEKVKNVASQESMTPLALTCVHPDMNSHVRSCTEQKI